MIVSDSENKANFILFIICMYVCSCVHTQTVNVCNLISYIILVVEDWNVPYLYLMVFFGIVVILLVAALTAVFLMLCKMPFFHEIHINFLIVLNLWCYKIHVDNRYQVRKQADLRHKALLDQDLRLNHLRSTADDSALTSFNPNYGCDAVLAGGIDVRQLPQVARDSLRLVK